MSFRMSRTLFELVIQHEGVPAAAGDLVLELLACGLAAVALIAEDLTDDEAESGDDQRPQ
jgi:hypothetical protein